MPRWQGWWWLSRRRWRARARVLQFEELWGGAVAVRGGRVAAGYRGAGHRGGYRADFIWATVSVPRRRAPRRSASCGGGLLPRRLAGYDAYGNCICPNGY